MIKRASDVGCIGGQERHTLGHTRPRCACGSRCMCRPSEAWLLAAWLSSPFVEHGWVRGRAEVACMEGMWIQAGVARK